MANNERREELMEYILAEDIAELAHDVAFDHHPVIAERGPIIEWVRMRKPKGGPTPLFQIKRITGIHAFLATSVPPKAFFTEQQAPTRICVTIGHYEWNGMSREQQKGMLDHILSHLRYDFEKETWRIKGPEFGEFPAVIERHGFWRPTKDFREFASALGEQLELWPEASPEPELTEDLEAEEGEDVAAAASAAEPVLEESMT